MGRPEIVRIEAVTRAERNEAIARISQAITSAGGFILDFRFFSNVALFIEAEASAATIHSLLAALADTGLQMDLRSAQSFFREPREGDMRTIHPQVTFVHSDPDLRIPVPPIPG